MSRIRSAVDVALEVPVVTSFTNVGYLARRRLEDWTSLDDYDLSDRVMVITGATSGLGRAAATQLARCGATIVVNGRNAERNKAVVSEIIESTGNNAVSQIAADMGNLDHVRSLAGQVVREHDRLDALIHNAGALSEERREAPSGIEATVASQVVGPFLLTGLLLDRLRDCAPTRVLTMSSGGMYTAALTVQHLQMDSNDYKGAEQYARAKRAQIVLNEMWAQRFGHLGVHFHALHPGWADTPGVDEALPVFSKVMGPLLRTPEQGADTLVWLAADDEALDTNGRFWLDRRIRSTHKLRRTRKTDIPRQRAELWEWVVETSGHQPTA